MQGCPGLDEVHHRLVDLVIVVTEGERARTIEEIDVTVSFYIFNNRTLSLRDRKREFARIASSRGFVITLTTNEVLVRTHGRAYWTLI